MEAPAHALASLEPPRPSQAVHREECTLCFDTQDSPTGIDVCLQCFNGACSLESTNRHSLLHYNKTGHALVVNIKRIKKVSSTKRNSNEPPIKKLAIREDAPEAEQYEIVTRAKIYHDDQSLVDVVSNEQIDLVVAGILSSMSSAQRSEVKAWEEEIVTCVHTDQLVQTEAKRLEQSGLATCAHDGCELTSNLWLCLTCGSLGCGRPQFGGGGGNGHGLLHTQQLGHPVAVKMGTIDPDGSADVYCYACDDARIDFDLAKHLGNFGIEVLSQKKTEKTMTELQVEHNLNFDFAMTGADGAELEPLCGPGLTGLKNLGNSCYMASSLQSLFALPSFQTRYLTSFHTHVATCTHQIPAECFECQMAKVADGLLSGRYAVPSEPSEHFAEIGFSNSTETGQERHPRFQEGIRPSMFKAIVGRGHPEFATMKQQDAGEFLAHLLEVIKRSSKTEGTEDPTEVFGFAFEERLQCSECGGVRYSKANEELLSLPVPIVETIGPTPTSESTEQPEPKAAEFEPVRFEDCLERLTLPEAVEYRCPTCVKAVTATKSTRFATFPSVLLVAAARFQFDNWVPKKVDVPLLVPLGPFELDALKSSGKQDHEVELPQPDEVASASAEPQFSAEAMNQLSSMGFPENRCKRALLATGNANADAAMEWLFSHMEDSDIDDPVTAQTAGSALDAGPSDEQLGPLIDMGFTAAQGRKALRETGGDAARAVDWLFSHPDDSGESETAVSSSKPSELPGSRDLPAKYRLKAFISHKGPSVHSGHYVAHIREPKGGWVLFNDEKVVKADRGAQSADVLSKLAYVYVFEKLST